MSAKSKHNVCPAGWYRIAWSHELSPGQVSRMKYFGQELVCYRGASGQVYLAGAYCPHLGANMAVGGRVEGDDLVCPFHGWQWSCDGKSAKVPYADRLMLRGLPKWETHEEGGIIFAWYAGDGSRPTWSLPELPARTQQGEPYYPIAPHTVKVWSNTKVNPQSMVENLTDPAHIKYVHKAKNIASATFEVHGHIFAAAHQYVFGEGKTSTWLTPNGPVNLVVRAKAYGIGVHITRYEGLHEAVQVSGSSPIDLEHSDMWNVTYIPRLEGEDETRPNDRWLRLFRQMCGQFEEDLPIWENMIYVDKPPYAPLEAKGYRAIRSWAEQFYLGDKLSQQQTA